MRTRQRRVRRVQGRVLRSRAGQAVLVTTGAIVLAQISAISVVPILARLYSPEEYGAFEPRPNMHLNLGTCQLG